MSVREYKDGDVVLARHVSAADLFRKPLQFYSDDADFIQFGTWSYDAGKTLAAHTHNKVPRTADKTQEVLYVCAGSIKTLLYDTNLRKVEEFVVGAGDLVVLLSGGHGYEILENGTRVIEIKNGPYVGAEADRTRL